MKVVICWTHISGYIAACWRALAKQPDVQVALLGFKSDIPGIDIKFHDEVVGGLGVRLMTPQESEDASFVRARVVEQDPDIVVVSGWACPAYRQLVHTPQLARAKFVMTMDTPYRGTLRQKLGRYKFAGYFARMDRVIVTGERAWQLARTLNIPEQNIRRGVYGIDYDGFAPLLAQRRSLPGGWPRRFLYTGRYHEQKGIDILLRAYREYRRAVADPWELTCCGTGPMGPAIDDEPGVNNRGFVQPAQLPEIMLSHGVFVLASRFDPWPLVIPEACAAGLPVIHTEACGSAVELVRPYYNGIGVATQHVQSLAAALRWCHEHHHELPEMGARSQPFAAAYSAQAWVVRWMKMFQELCHAG